MRQNEIETAFLNKLTAIGETPDENNLQWTFTDSDMDYTPTEGHPYMRGKCVMGDPFNASIADGQSIFSRQTGFYQVTLHYPRAKQSPSKMRKYAESVRRQFWDGGASYLPDPPQGSTQVDIFRMPGLTGLPSDGVYIRCALTIYFQVEDAEA